MYKVLTINPGSTSTKLGVFEDEKCVFEESISHKTEDICRYPTVALQFEFRKEVIEDALKKANIDASTLSCVVGRGGLSKPIESGTYLVEEAILRDYENARYGEHASNLGGALAKAVADPHGIPAFIVDPVVVDEMEEIARVSGYEGIERISIFHALNQKAVAKRHAKEIGKAYEDLSLIVVHMGGGISVGAHKNGRVVDVNNALDGEGPFTPERAGGLPVRDVMRLSFSGDFTAAQLKKQFVGRGGLVSYFGTSDAREVKQMLDDGDEKADLIYRAMAYQVAKEIGKCAVSLAGRVDGVLLTGGIAHDKEFTGWIRDWAGFVGEFFTYPGEDELAALAEGGLRILRGEETAKHYV